MRKSSRSALRPRRYQLLLPLKVWIRSLGKGKRARRGKREEAVESTTENISSSGCYFLLPSEPPVGSRLDLEIEMDPKVGIQNAGKLLCRGRVVRTERTGVKTGVGCCFERYRMVPSEKSRRVLREDSA